ncbi:hypothetical protein SAMN05216198_1630 [Halopseudomonas litoralis]|uniref:Uncharacterized protein n=1 Tax=Halopseudomonas litoralis TaxID=797277 RepID=A0A1H1R0W5_9GAMM|nr:hypothetical protein [Halopseudomonas litoralis]SDS29434.1 hypothetical protein SAMN05216198_1630 [Halopseudomonas litoralis]
MIATEVDAGWRTARQVSARPAASAWSRKPERSLNRASAWGDAQPTEKTTRTDWAAVPALDQGQTGRWESASPTDGGSVAAGFVQVPSKDLGLAGAWDHSIRPADWRVTVSYNPAPAKKDASTAPRYQRVDEYGPRYDAALEVGRSLYVPGNGPLVFNFGDERYAPSNSPSVFFDFRYVPPARVIQPVDSGAAFSWRPARQVGIPMQLLWGRGRPLDPIPTGIDYPDYTGPITIIVPPPAEPDILETYMIANSVSLAVLPDRTPLDATGIRVGLDIDSFAWTLSANLFGRTSLAQVRPDANGPKEVELTINGHTWVFIVERYSGTGKLADERYTITGVSQTQLLAKPYAPARSQSNTVPLNAQQAAELELQYTDFILHWDTWNAGPPDWTLPAGAFSYESKTPMEVIAELAETAGGIVSPSRNSRELTVLPRYKQPVWQWSSAIMDRIIPANIVASWGSEWQPQPEWNSCYVSGTNHGVSVNVRRAGTAGDEPAPDVFHDWITGEQAGRARGIAELCKGGNQEIITLDLPLFPQQTAPGLVEPAMLCEVRDIEETWRGLCLATEITAEGIGASRVKQTLKLERHHREGA